MKKFLLVLLVIVLVLGAVGFLISHDYKVEESIVIDAKPSDVHKLVADLERWDEWMPWREMDPTIQVTFGKETKGVGASQTWTGEDGTGFIQITASDEDKGIEYDMKMDEMPARGAIRYERVGDSTKVTWSMSGEIDTPVIGGYFALLMPRMIGGSFEKGLGKLKAQAEK